MVQIHETSDVQSFTIGSGTKIWQYCVILKGAQIGVDCNIGSHCFIESSVVIGDRVTIKNGVLIFDSIIIEDDVFIGPNVTFTNDLYPKSRRKNRSVIPPRPPTIIRSGSSVGAGTTVIPGVEIGKGALVGAGTVVTRSVPDDAVVYGTQGTIRRFLGE